MQHTTKIINCSVVGLLTCMLWSTAPAAAETQTIDGITLVKIAPGCFQMGRDVDFKESGRNELPRHKVCITKAFYLGETEVTQTQWVKVMGTNPSKYKVLNNPVESVNWNEVQEFISKLNAKTGTQHFRLPTEAEWEYAARAGSTGVYSFGDDPKKLSQYAWFGNEGYHGKSSPVAEKQPNPWGLYDMHGNVWEWVQDWYGENTYANSPENDPQGPETGKYKVSRGGSWVASAFNTRSAVRFTGMPAQRSSDIGFRLVWQP